MKVVLRQIGAPPEVRVRGVRREIWNPLRRYARKMRREFWKTTATWASKPTFKQSASFRAGEMVVTVETSDKVYNALDKGTRERWAIMSSDFVPKTKVGWIGSGPGAGHVLIRGKAMREAGLMPKPGIEARKFGETIVEKLKPEFEQEMGAALLKAMERSIGLQKL